MKKFFVALLSLTSVFVLSACLGGRGGAAVEVNIPDEIPTDEEIEIVMWHAFGDANQALINDMLEDFLNEYPNITLRQVGQGNYDDLRSATIQGTVGGSTPALVMGYPDHFVEYLEGSSLVPLDEYIGHGTFGVDLDDYNDAFIAENQQYADGFQYSMPLAKSTEMIVYNKDFFDHHGISFDLDDPITWEQLEQFEEDGLIGTGEWQVEHLFNVDSESNLFINSSTQWEAGYTNIDGEILIDNDQTRDMLHYFEDLMDRNILALPIEWDTAYGSAAFIDGDVAMTQGSTAGTRYNIPNNPDGKFGIFDFGVMPAIQKEDGVPSAIQQGPNIAIMANTTDEERLVAWEIIKELTTPENTAYFSMNTGYVPVRDSSYDLPEYQEFLEIGEDPANADDPAYPYALANRVAEAQRDYFSFEPPFTGRVTSSNARQEAGFLIEAIYTGTSVEDALQDALADLTR